MLMIFGLTSYLIVRIYTIYSTREYEYKKRDLLYTKEQMRNMNFTLGQFDSSLNFVYGLFSLPVDFDVLNNPYVEFLAWEHIFVNGLYVS